MIYHPAMVSSLRTTPRNEGYQVETLFELLLWINFLGGYIRILIGEFAGARLLYYICVHGTGILLILISLRYFKYLRVYIKLNYAYWFLYPMLLICFIGTVTGFLFGAPFFRPIPALKGGISTAR